MKITVAEITQNCTENGGYTRAQVESLGEAWPPIKGWKHRCAARDHTAKSISDFLRYRSRSASKDARKKARKAKKEQAEERKGALVEKRPSVVLYVDGVHVASKEFLSTYAWRSLRYEVLKEYGSKCMCCGATPADGAVMNVDHIKPRKLFPELALDRSNAQILCGPCNHGKGNSEAADFRSVTQRGRSSIGK